jgi:hypothetical protein
VVYLLNTLLRNINCEGHEVVFAKIYGFDINNASLEIPAHTVIEEAPGFIHACILSFLNSSNNTLQSHVLCGRSFTNYKNFPSWIHSKIATILSLYAKLTYSNINISRTRLYLLCLPLGIGIHKCEIFSEIVGEIGIIHIHIVRDGNTSKQEERQTGMTLEDGIVQSGHRNAKLQNASC